MIIHAAALIASLCFWTAAAAPDGAIQASNTTSTAAKKPNVVFILTDDQDLVMDSMEYMQGVKTHLTEQGTFYEHHYATVSLCCPSRASMWTGKAAHNTNVTDLAMPWGGYKKFTDGNWHKKWLPVWLQDVGYKTYYLGKFLNGHTIHTYNDPFPNGLTGNDFLLEPGTYQYLNATLQHNHDKWTEHPGEYSTDLITNKSMARIDEAAQASDPFFIAIAPIAPHSNIDWLPKKHGTPPVPAERHKHLFPNATVPPSDNFNPNKSSGASWIKELDQLDPANVDYIQDWYRLRLRALQAVDDLVNATVARLQSHGLLDNTYIVYSSDNGFHAGHHRLQPGKRCPYEEDINVPLVIRGPGIPKGQRLDVVTTHTDIAPTILGWTGAKGPDGYELDGKAIPTSKPAQAATQPWEHAQIEHWGETGAEGKFGPHENDTTNTYKALRVIGQNYSLYNSVWCNGDHEVYNMKDDSAQMHNLYNSTAHEILDVGMPKLQSRLDALLLVLKTCKGQRCYMPWTALHPDGKVQSLVDALDEQYDHFYEVKQNRVQFQQCERGYKVEHEMPIQYFTYGDDQMDARAEAYYNWQLFTD